MNTLLTSVRRALAISRAALMRRAQQLLGMEAPPDEPRVYWDESVSLTLSKLVHETETRASGRVQVISLAEFRDSVGELWEKYKSKILIIADSTIARMIGKGNTYIPQGEDAWLLLLSNLSEEEAQVRSDAIAETIGKKLVGAQFTAQETPMPAAERLDLSSSLNSDGSLNLEAVRNAVSKIRQTQISRVVKSRAKPQARLTSGTSAGPHSPARQVIPVYRQAWCAETESVDSFFFRAVNESGGNVYADEAPQLSDTSLLDLTKTAAAGFVNLCESGLQAKMAIPIPFNALRGPAAMDIQRLISSLPQRHRLLRLRVEIVQIPPDIAADALVAVRELFRAFVREVAFLIDAAAINDQVLALDHIMLGTEISPTQVAGDEEIAQRLQIFRHRAGRRQTYVLNLPSRATFNRAVHIGISEIGGPPLEDIKRLPHRVTIIHREDLLAT